MENLHEVGREAYEKRLQNFMAKYGQQAQDVIEEVTTTTIERLSPTTAPSTYGHYGPTPTATSAVWDSAAPTTHPDGRVAWFRGLNWNVWLENFIRQIVVPVFLLMGAGGVAFFLLGQFKRSQWEVGIKRLKFCLHFPSRQGERVMLWSLDKSLGAVQRLHDTPRVQEWRQNRARLWREYGWRFISCGLLLSVMFMGYREWTTPSCWVEIHDLQHQGLNMPDWAYEASRKQHGHHVELVKNRWKVFKSPVTTTPYHHDEKPTTQPLTATSTVSFTETAVQTVKVRIPATAYGTRSGDDPAGVETITIRETTTEREGPAVETITILSTTTTTPRVNAAAEEQHTVTRDLTAPSVSHDNNTPPPATPAPQQPPSADSKQPFISYILPPPVTHYEIIANVTPTTMLKVLTRTVHRTKLHPTTITGGTLVLTRRIPTTLTITATSVVTSLAGQVQRSTIYLQGKTTGAAGTIIRTSWLPCADAGSETRGVSGPSCGAGREEGPEEGLAHVCEDERKRIGYCKKCQQDHCCELMQS